MGFTELTFFFILLPLSIAIYLLADCIIHKAVVNNAVLVVFNLAVYYWASKETLAVFLAIVGWTYLTGRIASTDKRWRSLQLPVICLVGCLAFYKYASFIVTSINELTGREIIRLSQFAIPIGISFVVFEAISYVVDIYRGDAEPGTLLDCLMFLSLFPKLVSGPIVQWKDFYAQLSARKISAEKVSRGLDRIIIGYAKKLIIADTFGSQILLINSGLLSGAGIDQATY